MSSSTSFDCLVSRGSEQLPQAHCNDSGTWFTSPSDRCRIDLAAAVLRKIKLNAAKYPASKVKRTAQVARVCAQG